MVLNCFLQCICEFGVNMSISYSMVAREHVWNIYNAQVTKDFAIYSIHFRVVRLL